jgi:hypothetical protein
MLVLQQLFTFFKVRCSILWYEMIFNKKKQICSNFGHFLTMNHFGLIPFKDFRLSFKSSILVFSILNFKLQIFRVRAKQRTYFPLVSAMEMAIWQAILT